jgi:hypothetical protein
LRVWLLASTAASREQQGKVVHVCRLLALASDQPSRAWSGYGTTGSGFEQSSFLADGESEAWWLEIDADGKAGGCSVGAWEDERRVFVTGRLHALGGYGHLNAYSRQLDCVTMVEPTE